MLGHVAHRRDCSAWPRSLASASRTGCSSPPPTCGRPSSTPTRPSTSPCYHEAGRQLAHDPTRTALVHRPQHRRRHVQPLGHRSARLESGRRRRRAGHDPRHRLQRQGGTARSKSTVDPRRPPADVLRDQRRRAAELIAGQSSVDWNGVIEHLLRCDLASATPITYASLPLAHDRQFELGRNSASTTTSTIGTDDPPGLPDCRVSMDRISFSTGHN